MSFNVKSTVLALFALSGLGVACTITSGTVDDTGVRDGGPVLPTGDSGSGSDAGDAAAPTCEGSGQGASNDGGTKTNFINATCQACLEAKCCSELTMCFTKAVDQNVSGNCDELKACRDFCDTSGGADPATCRAGCDTANPSVSAEHQIIRQCGAANCTTECAGIDSASGGDGG